MNEVQPPTVEEVSLLARAGQVMQELLAETKGMKEGTLPDPMKIEGLQAELVEIRWLVGNEFSNKFSAKEKAILARKTGFANSFARHRKRNNTVKDSELMSLEDVDEKYTAEIDKETEFIHYKTLLDSLDAALAHSHSAVKLSKI